MTDLVEKKFEAYRASVRLRYRNEPKKRCDFEYTDEVAQRGDGRGFVQIHRIINRIDDEYYEIVVDEDTGKIERECTEKLSEHRDRGLARQQKPKE